MIRSQEGSEPSRERWPHLIERLNSDTADPTGWKVVVQLDFVSVFYAALAIIQISEPNGNHRPEPAIRLSRKPLLKIAGIHYSSLGRLQPYNVCFRLSESFFFGAKGLSGISVQTLPQTSVLRISAVFLKSEGTVCSRKNIDAIVAIIIFKRRENLVFHLCATFDARSRKRENRIVKSRQQTITVVPNRHPRRSNCDSKPSNEGKLWS